MNTFSTRQVAQKLGITHAALSKYISAKKIPAPKAITSGGMTIHLWTAEEIEHVRKLLPKIANGRKTRYKKQSVLGNLKSAITKKKAQARVPVPHKQRKPKKK
jgi:predicted transcriptional regulator